MISIRKSVIEDLPRIEEIYTHAREQMKINGNPHQWKESEPSIDKIINDINNQNHYCILENDRICGVFSLIFGEDPTYKIIDGKWLNDYPYITIHRIASDNTVKGILETAIVYGFEHRSTVRIDTHEENSIMRHLLERLGFTYCGIIYLLNGEPRLAYQKTI